MARIVNIVFGLSATFAIVAYIVALFHLGKCHGVVRVPGAFVASLLVFLFTALRFGLYVAELKLVSWLNVKLAHDLDLRIKQLRNSIVTRPQFLPEWLWPVWRLAASYVLPDYLLAEQQEKFVEAAIRNQFRFVRVWCTVVFGGVALLLVLIRIIVLGRIMHC